MPSLSLFARYKLVSCFALLFSTAPLIGGQEVRHPVAPKPWEEGQVEYQGVAHFGIFRFAKSLQVCNIIQSGCSWFHQELKAI